MRTLQWFSRLGGIVVAAWLFSLTASGAWANSTWSTPIGSNPLPSVINAFNPPSQRWEAGHRGVDLSAQAGQPVMTAGTGIVSYTGSIAGRGVVTVQHGELRTTYEPVVAAVRAGDAVSVGDVIGSIGPGGHCNGRCLHWGLLRGEVYLNPMLLLEWRPPVLKPLHPGLRQSPAQRRSEPTLRPPGAGPPEQSATVAGEGSLAPRANNVQSTLNGPGAAPLPVGRSAEAGTSELEAPGPNPNPPANVDSGAQFVPGAIVISAAALVASVTWRRVKAR